MDKSTNHDPHSIRRPVDFAFRFEYHHGINTTDSYYEYDIEVAPDGSGEIHYREDIIANYPDEFAAIFDPDDDKLELLYRLMHSMGICEPIWQPPRYREEAGGYTTRLDVTCGGMGFQISNARFKSMGDLTVSLIEAIRDLVPLEIWKKIEKQFPKP